VGHVSELDINSTVLKNSGWRAETTSASHTQRKESAMESTPTQGSGRRKGPVTFQAANKVTSVHVPPKDDPYAIAKAAGPSLETPKRSKQLRVSGPLTWFLLGAIAIVLGLVLLSIVPAIVGVVLWGIAYLHGRLSRTEERLHNEGAHQ